MAAADLLDVPAGAMHASYLAQVTSVQDPDNRNRVQVRLFAFDDATDQDAPLWARVAVPFAGADRGAFFFPDVGDEVLVTFVNGDPRFPVVVGGLWNGSDAAPEQLGGRGDRIDRWTIVGKHGTRIAIIEEQTGQERIELSTPGGQSVVIDAESGGSITVDLGSGTTVTLNTQGVSIVTGSKVSVEASTVEVTAGQVKVDAAMSRFSGVVQCDTLIATTVVATTYTPGAGNIW